MNKNMYVVVEANNCETDIFVSEVFATKKAAQKVLSERYKDVLATIDREDIEEKCKTPDMYSVLMYSGDYYYGLVKPVSFSTDK